MFIQKTWWDISSEEPYELVGRFVENAFGVPEIVAIPRIQWAYLDWAETECGCDVIGFIRQVDRERWHETETLSQALEAWTAEAFIQNEAKGNARPDWCPPHIA